MWRAAPVSGHLLAERVMTHPHLLLLGIRPSVDWSAVRAGKDDLVSALRKAKYEDVLAGFPEIELMRSRGVLDSDGGLHLEDGTPISVDRVVIATGSSPWIPDVAGLADSVDEPRQQPWVGLVPGMRRPLPRW